MDKANQAADAPELEVKRLTTLLRLVESAWVLAVYEDGAVQRQVSDQIRERLAPLPVLEISLVGTVPDPLAIIRSLHLPPDQPAPVICFTGVGSALAGGLSGYLDLQRETLAQVPHRLLFWVTDYDLGFLSDHAPNFYSRTNGIFRFPGRITTPAQGGSGQTPRGSFEPQTTTTWRRHRLYPTVDDEHQRGRMLAHQQRRIHDLINTIPQDLPSIADSYYDLGGLFEEAMPRRWNEAEVAYCEAARYYAIADLGALRAEALLLAGEAARRAYSHQVAQEHLAEACAIFRSVGDKLGEANTLQAIGDVQQFRDERDAALTSYQQALTLFRSVGAKLGEANVLAAQSRLLLDSDWPQSQALLEQALALRQQIDDVYSMGADLGNYGIALLKRGQNAAAVEYLQRARTCFAARNIDHLVQYIDNLIAQAQDAAAE